MLAVMVLVAEIEREKPLIAPSAAVTVDAAAITLERAASFATDGEKVEAMAIVLEIPREIETPNADETAIVRRNADTWLSDTAKVELAEMVTKNAWSVCPSSFSAKSSSA
jgi:hypothetical protein